MNDLAAVIRDQLLENIVGQVRSAGTEVSPMGPPCSAFYLLHYAVEGRPVDECEDLDLAKLPESWEDTRELAKRLASRLHFSRDRLLDLWRVTLSGVEELPVEQANSVTVGETRDALFENAKVSLWVDCDRLLAHIDWVYGPLYGRGFTYKIRRDGERVSLEDANMRWIS